MEQLKNVSKVGAVFLAVLAVFFGVKTVNELKAGALIGRESAPSNVITVSGKGEVATIQDIGSFSFSVTESAKTVAEAQTLATDRMNKALAFLKTAGVDGTKDVQTTGYNIYPKYEYPSGVCTQYGCPGTKQILTGYEVSQSVTVKVRDLAKTGTIVAGVGALNVQNLSGLNFEVEHPETYEQQARDKAIKQARSEAEAIAQSLGVKLVRITSFSENGGGYPYAMMYKTMSARADAVGALSAPVPEIPQGEGRITSQVTVTYEIR